MLTSFSHLSDPREKQGKQYGIDEIMMGGLSMFLFRTGSRNQLNNERTGGYFREHYRQMFGLRLPHQDAVHDVLCELDNEQLEQVKMDMMSKLFEQKWLRSYRLDDYYLVAVDATGIVSFEERHCPHCLTKSSKNGKVTYFHYVLEAKLVTHDGHALSLASEWIENPTGEYVKQDCERAAFIRLAQKLKKQYPRLPVCILADGLYPYENAFKICEDNHWKFIFVLQDKSLKTVQEELTLTRRRKPAAEFYTVKQGWRITETYRYQTDIEYHEKYRLNWIGCIETRNKTIASKTTPPQLKTETSCFEYVTNMIPDKEKVRHIGHAGRLRWKIENEGFNTQKNGDYQLEHKYSRKSYNGMKNYYTLLQLAHAINQLIEKGKCIMEILELRSKETIRNLWQNLKGYMKFSNPSLIKDLFEIDNHFRVAPA